MSSATWMSGAKGWGVLDGLYGLKGLYMWRPKGQIKSHFLVSELISQLLVSPSGGIGLGARKWWFWRDMISLADSLPFGYQWKMNTLRVLKKWLELELVVLEVECGRGIQIVLPQCGNITRERGLQALLTWVLVITYTLHVFCACFRRKKRIKNAILKWFTDSFSSTVPCAPQHVLPAILMHTWNSRPQSIQFVRRTVNKGCCVDVFDSMMPPSSYPNG